MSRIKLGRSKPYRNVEEKVRGKDQEEVWGVRSRDRMKRGSGMKGRDERSREMETLIAEVLDKIKPTDPSRLVKETVRRNRNYPIPPSGPLIEIRIKRKIRGIHKYGVGVLRD